MHTRFMNLAAIAAVFLAASPPASACTPTNNLPPDDRVVQRTEQIDEGMKMVTMRDADADRLVIPIVNRESYQIVAVGDYNAQILIFDDHPRFANIDHLCMCPVNKDLNVVTATRGLYLGNSHYYLNANGANATSFNPQVNCLQNNSPADRTKSFVMLPPASTARAWRTSWR